MSLALLPADLHTLIFSHVPVRPRLLVVALVCKRWLQIARNSVLRLPLKRAPAKLVSCLPSLTELDTPSTMDTLPTGLRSLRLGKYGVREAQVAKLSGLTSIDLVPASYPAAVAVLVTNNAPSLTALSLRIARENNGTLPPNTTDLRLQTLKLRGTDVWERCILRQLKVLLTQLTWLEVSSHILMDLDPVPSLTALAAPLGSVLKIQEHAPNLCIVNVNSFPSGWGHRRLSRLTKLHDVSLRLSSDVSTQLPPMISSLAALPLHALSMHCQFTSVSSLTTLRTLHIGGKDDYQDQLPPLIRKLPYLRVLRVDLHSRWTPTQGLELMRASQEGSVEHLILKANTPLKELKAAAKGFVWLHVEFRKLSNNYTH